MSDWLTTAEALAMLGLSRSRLAELRRAGVFQAGLHYSRPAGMRIRWRRSGLEEHLAGGRVAPRPKPRGKLAPHLLNEAG